MTDQIHFQHYDVIVIGAGHAGCEAAQAAARMGCRTLLLTIDLDKLAHMSCNPSIGGPAKGHLVREIDAMGGLMARVTDATFIQIRLLNESKGPAVQALRAQCDKRLYAKVMKETLEQVPGLDIRQAMVERVIPPQTTENQELRTDDSDDAALGSRFSVVTHTGRVYRSRALVLTTGTFLRGRAITGEAIWGAGRAGEAPAVALGEDLASLGFPMVRLKTGTPPRIDARTIDFGLTEPQQGSATALYFGHYGQAGAPPPAFCGPPAAIYPHAQLDAWRPQLPCYQIHTTPAFHAIVQANIQRAPLFSGVIEGVGPRYCPSIEDKIVRFADKERHGMFLEPEGWATGEVYVQGCNTSLPEDVQWAMLRSIPALRQVEIMRAGYAIEYDAIATGEITAALRAKRLRGLFLAGQINGTTGYEEAAAQGLMAGINAARFVQRREPVLLRRDQAYIGVLIDDLVTRGVDEPYRMFTSRAEYRLLLRQDNADRRLTPLGRRVGLVTEERRRRWEEKEAEIARVHALLASKRWQEANLLTLLRRPETTWQNLMAIESSLAEVTADAAEQVMWDVKYAGYIARQEADIERQRRLADKRIPANLDFARMTHLRAEAREKLARVRPVSLAQASRISGITPADLSLLLIHLDGR
jgi:tRNA uridine 5-carboxymethylaminomethyl modification enzyme